MNTKQHKTLALLFKDPIPAELSWADIESLFRALGVVFKEGAESRIRVTLNGVPASFHVPHSRRRAAQGRIRAVRMFLQDAGVRP